jgi:tetratricopeptide (TPR) repeat protein
MRNRSHGQKGRDERVVKRVSAPEIVDGVRFRLSENADRNQIEDHLAEVVAAADAPILKDRRHHRAELLQRVETDAFEELLAGDVAGWAAFAGLFALLDGVVERIAEEMIGVAFVARILLADDIEGFTKIKFLHRGDASDSSRRQTRWRLTRQPLQCWNTAAESGSELRGDTMHDDRKRQLLAPAAALLVLLGGPDARAEDRRAATAEGKLQAAKVIEAELAIRDASAEEWRKLDRIYTDLAATFPTDARVRNEYGESLWNRNERDRAMAQWEAAEKLDPKNAVVLHHLADGWLAEGDVRKSAAFAARAVSSEPENAAYHFALANISFLFRHELTDAAHLDSEAVLRRALSHFAEASRLAPGNAEYARAYAETFYSVSKPDWQTALAAWTRFFELVPQKDFALVNLARVRLKLGQKQAALDCLSRVQAPEYEELKRRIEAQANGGL